MLYNNRTAKGAPGREPRATVLSLLPLLHSAPDFETLPLRTMPLESMALGRPAVQEWIERQVNVPGNCYYRKELILFLHGKVGGQVSDRN